LGETIGPVFHQVLNEPVVKFNLEPFEEVGLLLGREFLPYLVQLDCLSELLK